MAFPFFLGEEMDILHQIENLLNKGDTGKAKTLLKKSKLKPSMQDAVLASIALKENDIETAEVLFEKAIKQDSNNIVAIGNYGVLLVSQKKFKRALPYIEKAHKVMPTSDSWATNYAACLAELDRYEEAIKIAEPYAYKDGKPNIGLMITICSMYRAILKPEIALEWLMKIRQVSESDITEVERAEADIFAEMDPEKARLSFEKAIKTTKNPLAIEWNWSFVELRLQNFEKGWKLFESGLSDKIGKIGRPLPNYIRKLPMITELEDINPDKYTVFTVEQGIGDQVLFFGCFDQVLKQYPKSILVCERRMRPIFSRAFPQIEIFEYGMPLLLEKQAERFNGVFPIGSLQKYFRKSIDDYEKNRKNYLIPNAKLVEEYSAVLKAIANGKKIIGISWIGGFWDRQKKTKSFEFEIFSEILRDDRYLFVSLQYGDTSKEKKMVEDHKLPVKFIEGIDFKTQMDEWLALTCCCDRIVSVSTALVHFAGAAGKRVDVLLADHQSPFIWGTGEGRALPYTETYIHRKNKQETHSEFLQRVKKEIL